MFLTLDYRPSQPHGWLGGDKPLGVTFGGHTVATEYTADDRHYRVSLLPREPVSRAILTDQFQRTLDTAFGAHYAFRFLGHPSSRDPFSVQSYTVSANSLSVGADLYVVHDTDPLDVTRGTMRWLQVSRGGPIASDQGPRVDGMGPANPFFPTGGSVSVNGTRVGNFLSVFEAPLVPLDFQFTAEAFLARDTGTKDGSGREIVEVFRGVAYGWEVRS